MEVRSHKTTDLQ